MAGHSDNSGDNHEYGVHHIVSNKVSRNIFLTLLAMTIITVVASRIDLGKSWNFALAMAIATFKAMLVTLFFMGLKYDSKENRSFFYSSFIFVFIFITQTAADIFTRPPNWEAKGDIMLAVANSSSGPQFKRPWDSSPELLKHGKELFAVNCALCHGAEGHGDGPGGAGLPVKPRNYTKAEGWKNGRKPSDVFMTLKTGIAPYMPPYAQLSENDRWALAHFVLSLGPAADAESKDSLARAGVLDPSKDDGGVAHAVVQRKLPADFAMERYIQSGQ